MDSVCAFYLSGKILSPSLGDLSITLGHFKKRFLTAVMCKEHMAVAQTTGTTTEPW